MWQKLRIRYIDYEEVALQTCSLTEMEFLILYPCSSWSQVNLARGELNKPDNDFQLSGRPGTTLILPTQNSLVCLRRTKGPSGWRLQDHMWRLQDLCHSLSAADGIQPTQGSGDTQMTFPTSLWENSPGGDKISVARTLQGASCLGSKTQGNSSDLA